MKKFLIPVLSLILTLTICSCSKQVDQKASITPPSTPPVVATSFGSIKAADNFTWSTTNKVNFSFTGSSTDNYTSVLKVIDANGNLIFQKLQNSTQNYAGIIEISGTSENVSIVFGDNNKTVNAKTGIINLTLN